MSILTWKHILKEEKKKQYFIKILNYLESMKRLGKIVYPKKKDVFNAFRYTEFSKIKVVILGQDPYHGKGQANGLAFSVSLGIKLPPTLINIYKELKNDVQNFQFPKHGYLIKWAEQGVFLLNSILTVEKNKAFSHSKIGWESFTDQVISKISKYRFGIIFLLWGQYAKKKINLINKKKHFIFCSSHPSPLSAHKGFIGCAHFSKVNKMLIRQNLRPIDWSL